MDKNGRHAHRLTNGDDVRGALRALIGCRGIQSRDVMFFCHAHFLYAVGPMEGERRRQGGITLKELSLL